MEYELAAIVAQLTRIADALDRMSGIEKERRWSPREYRFLAAYEIDDARDVRDELDKRAARIKEMDAK